MMRTLLALLSLLTCLALVAPRALAAPYGVKNRPEDDWKVVETEHFRVYFTDDTRRTAARIVEIIEDTYARLNAFYHYRPPGKIGITVVGYTTYSNGFADFSRNRITIFTTPIDSRSPNPSIYSCGAKRPWAARSTSALPIRPTRPVWGPSSTALRSSAPCFGARSPTPASTPTATPR
jgi:hypothetical protein